MLLGVLLILAQLGDAECQRGRCRVGGRVALSRPLAYFEFATSFSSWGAECACSSSVAAGTHGEVVSVIRDGGAMCTIGNLYDGIDVGDLIWCEADQLRVMSGGDVGNGVLSEAGATNLNTSQDFSNTPWSAVGLSAAAPTASPPDAGICPDGTNRATRITIGAVGASGRSFMSNATGCPNGGPTAASMYVRGVSYDGGLTMRFNDIDAVLLPYSVNTWTRVKRELPSTGGTPWYFGSDAATMEGGGVALGATDFLVCFAQCEVGTVSSYTPSTRAMDITTSSVLAPVGSDMQVSATVFPESTPITSFPYSVSYTYATYVAAQNLSGFRCRNEISSITDYVPTDAGVLGQLASLTPATLMCGWDALPVITLQGNYSPETWPGTSTACFSSNCADGGTTRSAMGTVGDNAMTVNFGGIPGLVEFSGQPNAIIKDLTMHSASRRSIYVYGDSIVGDGPTAEVLHNLMWLRRGSSAAVQNHGESGATIDDCKAEWDDTIAAVKANPWRAPSTYMLVQCGTNSADDDAHVVESLQAMLLSGRDAGVHAAWATITPRNDHCPFVLAVNSAMQTWCSVNGFTQVDSYTPLWSGPDCAANSAYMSDSLHPNDAGAVVMVNAWINGAGW